MEDSDLRFHSGIPVGHKFLAILLALAVAGAGCAWLIYRSGQSASSAVLAYNSALAQQLDSGLASATNPAVALADTMLTDQTIAKLAPQARLAGATPAGQIGEFRSDLQLTGLSPERLAVRFQTADPSQSISVSNAVAHALMGWTPAAASPAPAQSATSPAQPAPQPAPAGQGQSFPAAAQPAPAPSAAASAPPLSQALGKIRDQLSATDQQLDRAAGGGAQSSYSESSQQALLKSQIRAAQRTFAGLHHQFPQQADDPDIRTRLNEIHQALDSVLPTGFYAVGVSTSELRNERSELRQAIRIVDRETKGVQADEAAHPSWSASAAPPASAPPPEAGAATAAPSAAAPATQPANATPPNLQEQSISPTGAVTPAAPQSAQSVWSIVHLAAPAQRPPLWPALVAGAICGLLYLGIAAIAYRRGASDDIYPDLRSAAPQRMITPAHSAALEESSAAPDEPLAAKSPRQRAAFVFQPGPSEDPSTGEKPAASAEEQLPSR